MIVIESYSIDIFLYKTLRSQIVYLLEKSLSYF